MSLILTLQVPLTLPSVFSKTDLVFLKEDTQKYVFNNTCPRACISQYNPIGVYWLVQALDMNSAIHTPEHLLNKCTEHLVLAHSAICRQAQSRASVRMHLVRAHVMSYDTVTLKN